MGPMSMESVSPLRVEMVKSGVLVPRALEIWTPRPSLSVRRLVAAPTRLIWAPLTLPPEPVASARPAMPRLVAVEYPAASAM